MRDNRKRACKEDVHLSKDGAGWRPRARTVADCTSGPHDVPVGETERERERDWDWERREGRKRHRERKKVGEENVREKEDENEREGGRE